MSRTPSFVTIPSEKVRELAQACLDSIERRNQRVLKKEIDRRLRDAEVCAASWWGRLWGTQVPSREEIEKSVLSEGWASMDLRMYAWGSRDAAERLLKAVRYADTVQVSSEDLDMLGE